MITEGLAHDQLEKLTILLKLGKVYIDEHNHYCFSPGNNHNLFRIERFKVLYSSLSLNHLITLAWQKFKN